MCWLNLCVPLMGESDTPMVPLLCPTFAIVAGVKHF